MRAAMFHGPGKPITIERVADPEPTPNEILVKICRCGICGSDVSMTSPGAFTLPLGTFGHEYGGEVLEVGRNVTGIRVGDRVACLPSAPCGKCEGCRNGNPLFCTDRGSRCGGFSEYIAMSPKAAVILPRNFSLADSALVEPMACGVHALRLARMRGGERIVVMGAGAMALSAIYWGRLLGAGKIVAMSRSAHRQDVVMAMGADKIVGFDADDSTLVAALGGPPDIVVECVGKDGMLPKAINLVRPEGTVISMGMCQHNEPVLPALCAFKEIRLFFPLGYTVDEFIETARVFESGGVRPEMMVSEVIGLDELPQMLEELRGGRKSLKVQVDPQLRAG